MKIITDNTPDAPQNSMPVKDLYELIIVWFESRLDPEPYIPDLLSIMESAGIQLPRGLVNAVNDGEFEGKTAVEIIKRLLAHL